MTTWCSIKVAGGYTLHRKDHRFHQYKTLLFRRTKYRCDCGKTLTQKEMENAK